MADRSEPLECQLLRLWDQGQRPRCSEFLAQAGTVSLEQLVAVLRVDQRARWHAGERVAAENYFEAHPELSSEPELALELIYAEFLLADELGEAPSVADFSRRFPQHAERLQQQIELHRMLEGDTGDTAARLDSGASTPTCLPEATTATLPLHSGANGWPQIPGYEIVRELGRGGMGVVYEAQQLGVGRRVALKMILAEGGLSSEHLARFRAEAEVIGRLKHPNIVQVYEVGEHEGRPFLSIELVEGGSLDQRLRGTVLPARDAASLVETLARAMAAAHQCKIIHRDLKPANVLLGYQPSAIGHRPEGETPAILPNAEGRQPTAVKITDFGLAKRLDSEHGQTRTGDIMGTPSYMAPEQARGETGQIGPPADIHALGAILYELLAGRPPFRGETILETLQLVLYEEPVPPRRLQPRLARDLETICLKCLRKEPHRRYASAEALADDLHRFLAGEPIRARPVGLVERGIKWAYRRPAVAALTAGIVLITVLAFAVVLSLWLHADAERERKETAYREANAARTLAETRKTEAEGARQQAETEKSRAVREKERAEANSYLFGIGLAERYWRDNNVALAEQVLSACPPAHRHWEWYYLKRLCRARGFTQSDQAGPISAVTFSSDGKRFASLGGDGSVVLRDAETGQRQLTLDAGSGAGCLAFHPDGRQLATGGPGSIRIWDALTGRETRSFKAHQIGNMPGVVNALAYSGDGKWLASAGSDMSIKFWDAQMGVEGHTLRGHTGLILHLTFSRDGAWLASTATDSTIRLWDVAMGKEVRVIRGRTGPGTRIEFASAAFSPDGQRLASTSFDGTVKIWDTATGQEIRTLRGHDLMATAVMFSLDGKQIISSSYDRNLRVWDAVTGQEIRVLRGHLAPVLALAGSPDGQSFVSAGGEPGRPGEIIGWRAAIGQESRTLRGHSLPVLAVAAGPGQLVASAGFDSTIRLWQADTGTELAVLRGPSGAAASLAFNPNGKLLVSAQKTVTVPGQKTPPGEIVIWDVDARKPLRTQRGHTGSVLAVAFSPDGQQVVSGGIDRLVKLWDVETGRELRTLQGHKGWVNQVAFSPDGKQLASAASAGEQLTERGRVVLPGEVKVWDAVDGHEVMSFKQPDSFLCVAFSPDGKQLAAATGDHTARQLPAAVRVWDLATGREVLTLRGHTAAIRGLVFSPDGNRLFTSSSDNSVRVWDVSTGREVLSLRGSSIRGLAFDAQEGRSLMAASDDGAVWIWDAAFERKH